VEPQRDAQTNSPTRRPARPPAVSRPPGAPTSDAEYLLGVQRSAGNRAATQAVRQPAVVVHRAPPSGPAAGPMATAPMFGTAETVRFRPEFEIVPGGLGANASRTQQKVFRGDTLIFRADVTNVPSARCTMTGKVVGESPATCSIAGGVATWRVVVGNMGVPGPVGQPASLIDATPTLALAPPMLEAGKEFARTYQFRVVADLSWLSGQCSTAGARLSSAFMGLASVAKQAYLNYEEAYQLHKTAVDNHGKRKQLEQDILLGILLAGVGGSIGGAVAERVKSPATEYLKAASAVGSDGKLGGAAIATSLGDISKYIVRLGGVHAPGSTGQHGPDTPSPTASAGTSKAAGTSPERWLALKEKELLDAAKTGVDSCNDLKKKMDEAWAEGRTDLMDVDPVQLVQKNVEDMTAAITISTPKDYAIGLWRTWIHAYGITAVPNFAGGRTRTDELAGHTAFTDSKLYDDIHKQIGDALDGEISQLRQELAPDLTELPD
jgi:hypothetical protein